MSVARTHPLRVTAVAMALGALGLAGCEAAGATGDAEDAADRAATAAAEGDIPVLDADATRELLEAQPDAVVIDVRTPEEVAAGALDGALAIDVQRDDFEDRIDELDRDATYVLYCRTGNRSAQAAQRMAERGFTDLHDAGAYEDLAAVGLPTTP